MVKALTPPRISQIFQSAEIPKRKSSEILKEFLGGASMLHQNIPKQNSIIFAAKFLQSRRYKKFSVEHTLCGKMWLHTRKVKQRLSFLNESLKNNCSKADCKISKIKAIVQQVWLKAIKNYFANRPNPGLPNSGKSAK